MEYESKDVIVLAVIRSGVKNFDKIVKTTKIEPEEINQILERLEQQKLLTVVERKNWFGKKIELQTTNRGDKEVENRIHELEDNWNQMVTLYKKGDKESLNQHMENNRSFLSMMMFFGVIDIMMFSMMFSMIGASMTDFVPADQIPADMGAEGMEDGGIDDDGFDFDIGF